MRKIVLLFALIALLTSSYGQQAMQAMRKNCEVSAVDRFTPTEWQEFKSTKAFGDVIWEEDFSGSMPAGWVTVDNNSLGNVWIWTNSTNPGLGGNYSTNTPPFGSTTAANGYMDLPGDDYNTPVPSAMQDMDAYLKSPAINCDTAHSVMLKFEHYFRYCCGGDQIMEVAVSSDNVNWTSWDVSNDVVTNTASANPEIVYINITSVAALQSTVYIKFSLSLVSHYYWAVDDVQLITALQNDIRFAEGRNYFWDPLVGEASGAYSKLPASQIMSNTCGGFIRNNGEVTQTDVTYEATIFNGAGTQVYNGTADTTQLSFNDTAVLYLANDYIPVSTPDIYTLAARCYQDQVDELPEDNILDTISWEITSNNIMMRDRPDRWNQGTISTDFFTGGLPGDYVGVDYYLPNTATVNSISYYVDYRSTPGTILKGQIYKGRYNANPVDQIGTEDYTVQPQDLGTWVTVPMYIMTVGSEVLAGGNNYIVGAEFYYNTGEDLWLGDEDDAYPHMLWLETVVKLGSTWGWIGNALPYIRLNLEGAVLPPVFTSNYIDTCRLNLPYSYTASVTDPQSLPLTLTATTNITTPNFLTFTDNGNGTITVNTISPAAAGMTVGTNKYRIRITADNGTTTNEQYFWVDVLDPLGVNEAEFNPVNIYPNPAQNVLYVENANNASIRIFNLLGELVTSIERAEMLNQINIDGLAAGTYIISVVKNNEVVTKKFNKL